MGRSTLTVRKARWSWSSPSRTTGRSCRSSRKGQRNTSGATAAQGGEQVRVMTNLMTSVAEAFVRDGQTGIVGIGLGDGGITLDFGAQFKEGSASAKLLSQPGKAANL